VEPCLVAKMRSDEGSGGNFFYGPAVMVPHREPFANERYLFGVRPSLIQIIFLAWIQMKTWMKLFR